MRLSNNQSGLLPVERRAAFSLSLVYGSRMLGLFIVLPVFAVLAQQYPGATPLLVGIGLGIYGLFQALLQIPFGMLSDTIGRKPIIIGGLIIFVVGSIVAAKADSIYELIAGRALQGAGAISAALIALAADLTRDEQRTKVMAILGGSIGLAFVLSMIAGPALVTWFSLSALFWFTALLACIALAVLVFTVPTPVSRKISGDTVARRTRFMELLRDRQLLRLDISIFILHLLVTAAFVGVPLALTDAGVDLKNHWVWYLPALLLSVLFMVPQIIFAERHRQLKLVFRLAVCGLLLAQVLLFLEHSSALWLFIALTVFFSFFNTLEAMLPSLISKLAPAGAKGTAMGIYSTAQFAGAFVGGAGGGWLYQHYQLDGLFLTLAGLCVVWFIAIWGLQSPKPVSSVVWPVGQMDLSEGPRLVEQLMAIQGVDEAVVVREEGVAYLKVDRRNFDPETLGNLSLSEVDLRRA